MNLRLPTVRGGERQITGRGVFVMLVVFFGLVMIVNVVMIQAAISTFGGVDTPSSYQAGLDFKKEEAAADAQHRLGWQVDGHIESAADGLRTLTVEVHDKTGEPVSGLDIQALLAHPVDARRDVAFEMLPAGRGVYLGSSAADPGQWRLDIDVVRNGERLFRSHNRVTVR